MSDELGMMTWSGDAIQVARRGNLTHDRASFPGDRDDRATPILPVLNDDDPQSSFSAERGRRLRSAR